MRPQGTLYCIVLYCVVLYVFYASLQSRGSRIVTTINRAELKVLLVLRICFCIVCYSIALYVVYVFLQSRGS